MSGKRIVARGPQGQKLDTEAEKERNRREYEEETGSEMPAKRAKKAPAESMLAKLGRLATEASASVKAPWSRFIDDEEDP